MATASLPQETSCIDRAVQIPLSRILLAHFSVLMVSQPSLAYAHFSIRALTRTGIVFPSNGSIILLVDDYPPDLFCCGSGYNNTTNECETETHDSSAPFHLDPSEIIYDRSSGSTGPNSTTTQVTQASHATVTVTATATVTPTLQNDHDLAIGLGVGLPLGLLVLVTSSLLWRQLRQQKRVDSTPGQLDNNIQAPAALPVHYDPYVPKSELEGRPLGETGNRQRIMELGSH